MIVDEGIKSSTNQLGWDIRVSTRKYTVLAATGKQASLGIIESLEQCLNAEFVSIDSRDSLIFRWND